MPLGLTPLHLVIILVIALVILGPGKLPEVGSALGKSIREFRQASGDAVEAFRVDATAPVSSPAAQAPVPTAPVVASAPMVAAAEQVPAVAAMPASTAGAPATTGEITS